MSLAAPSRTADLVKTTQADRSPDEVLRLSVSSLQGVSSIVQTTLATLEINTVFDLATSRIFAAARRLLAAERDPQSIEVRLDAIPADEIDRPAGVAVANLAGQSIAILRRIGAANANAVAAALNVSTVRDLALWPPFLAAIDVLNDAFFPSRQNGYDLDSPADLLPQSGVYPTERVFYRKLLIDATPPDGQTLPALEQATDAIDILPGILSPTGFDRFTTGALLTFSQSWFSQGLTLGQLLHSTSLAPGESTRLAMIDWTRRTSASTSEDITETEQLSATEEHNRALSEVTNATATELQTGSSHAKVQSGTSDSGGAAGIEIGPLALGGSGGSSTTTTDAMSASSSFGLRDVSAQFAQSINDSTQQNASSARNRRASIVREVSQEEHEAISTRVLTNYNHMHALSVQYYEVVQAFRVTTVVDRVERCLFVPVQLMNFRDQATVERWRFVLGRAALSPDIAKLLGEFGSVLVTSQLPWVPPLQGVRALGAGLSVLTARTLTAATDAGSAASTSGASSATPTPAPATTQATTPPPSPVPTATTPIARMVQAGWNIAQLERLGRVSGRLLVPTRTNSIYIDDDALLIGIELRGGQASRFRLLRQDGSEVLLQDVTTTRAGLDAPVRVTEMQSIALESAVARPVTTTLTLQLNLFGSLNVIDVPIQLSTGGDASGLQECIRFDAGRAMRDLVDHLEENKLHYTQAILRSLDGADVAALLARFTFRGLPLPQLVDQQPVAVSSNFLVFRMNMPATGDSDDPHLAADLAAWRKFLSRTGLDRPVPKTEIVPLPSGGVFGEAVLGRFNSAEHLDLQRFWNWQDSPIPLVPPEIAAVTAESRAQPEDLTPGQLAPPVVSIQAPTALPDPTGVAAIVAALQNGNMFRDMSGLAQTVALAQAAQTASAAGATSAMQQAGQNLQTVMDQNTQRLRIAAQLAAQLAGLPVSGADGKSAPPGRNSVTERGGELREASLLDAQNQSGGLAPAETNTFKNLTGASARELANKVVAAAGVPVNEPSTANAAASTPSAGNVTQKQTAPAALTAVLNLGSPFMDASIFPAPVQIEATITDQGGKRVWSRNGPASATFTGTLNTSDDQLSLSLSYTYQVSWPSTVTNHASASVGLKIPPGATRVDAVAWVLVDDRTIGVDTGTPPANDAALAQLLEAQGIDTTLKVLSKPTVAARSGGGFDVSFKYFRGVVMEQLAAPPTRI